MNMRTHQAACQAAGMGNEWAQRYLDLMVRNDALMTKNTHLTSLLDDEYKRRAQAELDLRLVLGPPGER